MYGTSTCILKRDKQTKWGENDFVKLNYSSQYIGYGTCYWIGWNSRFAGKENQSNWFVFFCIFLFYVWMWILVFHFSSSFNCESISLERVIDLSIEIDTSIAKKTQFLYLFDSFHCNFFLTFFIWCSHTLVMQMKGNSEKQKLIKWTKLNWSSRCWEWMNSANMFALVVCYFMFPVAWTMNTYVRWRYIQ